MNKNLENFSKWKPNQQDINWTKNFLNNQSEGFVWVTTFYSAKINKEEKHLKFLDMNFRLQDDPKETFENVSRLIKILKKLGWSYTIPKDKNMVMNMNQETRLIPEVGLIDKDTFIPTDRQSRS
jgi:hypothetical protein